MSIPLIDFPSLLYNVHPLCGETLIRFPIFRSHTISMSNIVGTLFVCLFTVPLCGSWQCVQREYRRPHSPVPRSSTPSVFNSNIPSPTAFLGRSVFLCTVPLSLLPVVAQWAQRKPPSDSVSMGHSWGKSLESYFGV